VFGVYRGGKWLVAISVTAGAPRIDRALHHHKDSDDGSNDSLLISTSASETDERKKCSITAYQLALASRCNLELVADFGA
jgi:hypothetical protein